MPHPVANVLLGDAAVHANAPGAAGLRASTHHGRTPWSPPVLQQRGELKRGGGGGLHDPILTPPPPPPPAPAVIDELGIAELAMAPPLPILPPPPVPSRCNTMAAANSPTGLLGFIPTGHVPTGASLRGA